VTSECVAASDRPGDRPGLAGVVDLVIAVVAEFSGRHPSDIRSDSELFSYAGGDALADDSLMVLELVCALEEAAGVELLQMESIESLTTVSTVAEYIWQLRTANSAVVNSIASRTAT